MKLIVYFAVLLAVTYASKEEISRKLIGEIQSASPKCLKETGATNADVAILLRHQMPESRNGKCLLFCLHKHFHIQTADGTTDPDGVLKFLEYVKSEDANVYDLITKIVDNCRNVEIDADPCNTAVNIGKCAVAESKKIGLGAELFDMEII